MRRRTNLCLKWKTCPIVKCACDSELVLDDSQMHILALWQVSSYELESVVPKVSSFSWSCRGQRQLPGSTEKAADHLPQYVHYPSTIHATTTIAAITLRPPSSTSKIQAASSMEVHAQPACFERYRITIYASHTFVGNGTTHCLLDPTSRRSRRTTIGTINLLTIEDACRADAQLIDGTEQNRM